MNKADSERMAGTLEKMGYIRADDELNADLAYIIHVPSETMLNKKFIAFWEDKQKESTKHLT